MSHESIDDLYERWQRNPDPSETAALCEALRGSWGTRRPDLVEIVGSHAARQLHVPALLAAARMYTDTGRLDDAQSVLLTAGRLAPRDGDVYRYLGEVLLRRGDAERAEKVLEKALQFSVDGSEAHPLLDSARRLIATQRASGTSAVAHVVAQSGLPSASSTHMAVSDGKRKGKPIRERVEVDEEVETLVRPGDDIQNAITTALAPLSGASARPAAGQPPPPSVAAMRRAKEPPPSDGLVFTTAAKGLGFDIPETGRGARGQGAFGVAHGGGQLDIEQEPASVSASTAAFGGVNELVDGHPNAPTSSPYAEASPEPPVNPLLLEMLARPSPKIGGASIPEARDVLDALQIAGVYEPMSKTLEGPQAFTWAKPERVRRLFSAITLGALALVLVGGGFGVYYYVLDRRAKEHLEAEALLAQVDKDLKVGEAHLLEPAERSISKAFELESRSAHAALTWLRERAIVGLLTGGADVAFEDSIQRAKSVGVADASIAFAHVASFLYQGDTAGAAATVAKWDEIARDDAWFQLLAGATFERAGDTRAVERYSATVTLDPELVIAQMLLIRAMAVDGDAHRAAEMAKEFRARHPQRAEGAALVALAWSRDPERGEEPPEIKDVIEKGAELPVSLRSIPHAARAIRALHQDAVDEARPALKRGLALADTPGIASWLGGIALVMGDEELARSAALSAISYSAVYPPARVLAARVALLGGRLDEALKAAEELPPSSVDVAIVVAAASYEKLDGERMARAFDAVPDDAKKNHATDPLLRGQALLAGNASVLSAKSAQSMADDEAPWADLVAMDWALDTGELEMAKKIAEGWRGEPRPMRALRLARLARYEGRLDDAERLSRRAIEGGTVTMRTLSERVFTLVALERHDAALSLFKAYPNVGGPLAKWLRAYATAAQGKTDEARAMVSQEDPPSPAATMPARIIAASAYAMMKDTRHGTDYTKPLVQSGFANPDVVFASDKLGAGKFRRRAH